LTIARYNVLFNKNEGSHIIRIVCVEGAPEKSIKSMYYRSLGAVTSFLGLVRSGERAGSSGEANKHQHIFGSHCALLAKQWPTKDALELSADCRVAPCHSTQELLKDAMNADDAARRYAYRSVLKMIYSDSVLIIETNVNN
jgi:hypothetical protein